MAKYKAVKGVKDVLPLEVTKWQFLEKTGREIFERYGFREIRVPIFEKTSVFSRSLGDTTDIVEKEMYTFEDRGGDSLTLRPEGTASVVRAYVEHQLYLPPSVTRLYYGGPMFRRERPQAGRYRQFHQLGAEVFGTENPEIDAETIAMLVEWLEALHLKNITLHLNSLGCPQCRPTFRRLLTDFVRERSHNFCETCNDRFVRNPLRIFDCKSKGCQEASGQAPILAESLCQSCVSHFEGVEKALKYLDIPYTLNPRLVRGLDYYSKTAFEITAEGLGSQNAVAGGGRYDSLVKEFGGPPTPAFGFAVGMERILSLIDDGLVTPKRPDLFIAALGEEAAKKAFDYSHELRKNGFVVERDYEGGGLKSQMKKANRSQARYTLIVGSEELSKGIAPMREMESGDQEEVPLNSLCEHLKKKAPVS